MNLVTERATTGDAIDARCGSRLRDMLYIVDVQRPGDRHCLWRFSTPAVSHTTCPLTVTNDFPQNAPTAYKSVPFCRNVRRQTAYKAQLSLTNPRDALHHGERAGGRCV